MFSGSRGNGTVGGAQPQALVPAPSARPAPAPAPAPPPATFTGAWLDEQRAGSRTAQVIDDYLGEVGCLAGATRLVTNKARGSAAALVSGGERVPCDLGAINVTTPAYEDSNSRWQADRTLATIQSAVTAANYTLERFHLPRSGSGDDKNAGVTDPDARHGPGVLLFRRVGGADVAGVRWQARDDAGVGRTEVLAVLTVPEMPMSGIERVPLLLAGHMALTLHALPHPDGPAHAAQVRLVGPFYSGSSLSLLRGLEELAFLEGDDEARRGLQVRVISGSATGWSNCHILSGALAHDGQVTFERTVHEDETLLLALQDQLASIRPEWASGQGIALLVESNTGWGASLVQSGAKGVPGEDLSQRARPQGRSDGSPCGESATARRPNVFPEALRLGFPLHIADRYASRQYGVAAPAEFGRLMAATEALRLEDSATASDRLPTFTPNLTDAARDLTLDGILTQLQRRRIGAIGILSTDERDRLFLAREINHVSPDVILFGTEPDILMLHPDYAPYVRGMLMASSYPLQGHAQTLTHGEGMQTRRVQFTSMAQQGIYNALLLSLGDSSTTGPLLIDYRAPQGSWPRDKPAQCGGDDGLERPVPWIVVVGQREFTPFSVHPALVRDQDCEVMRGRVRTSDDTDSGRYLFASGQERAMWLLLPLTAIGLIALLAVARRRVLASARWLSPPPLLWHLERPRVADGSVPAKQWPRQGESAAHAAEHAILASALGLALALFAVWQVHLWLDVLWPGVPDRDRTLVAMLREAPFAASLALAAWALFGAAVATGAAAVVLLGVRRLLLAARARAALRARWTVLARRAVASSAPEVIAALVIVAGAGFVGATLVYLWRRPPGSNTDVLFASSRAFDLANLLSPAPLLTIFPGMVGAWMVWSLRTLYYQRISPTCALPLVHALVSRDLRDRRLEHALVATLGTTMQPAGVYLLLPAVVLVLIGLLLEPRVASVEGAAFGRVLFIGTTLGALGASLELGQAAWLARRVRRLLERVRIHPIVGDVEAMEHEPFDWRPALRPAQSPHRLLLRALRAAGEQPAPDGAALVSQDRVPVLRTEAWRIALTRSGEWLRHGTASASALSAEQRKVIAMVISLLLQSLVTRVVRGFGISALLATMLLAGHLLTAFSGRSLALLLDIGLIVVSAALAIHALLTLERDHVLSKLWHGTPGSLNLNSGLVWRAVVYAGLPLLTIISMRFPEVGGQVMAVVEPLRHILPSP
jgi:hypothetical protein